MKRILLSAACLGWCVGTRAQESDVFHLRTKKDTTEKTPRLVVTGNVPVALVRIIESHLVLEPFGGKVGNTGEARFRELAANGNEYVGFKAPDDIPANMTWILPPADGTNGQVLTTKGNGELTWSLGSSSFLTGSGTPNYVAKFTGPQALGSSQVFDNGTNVGIGTTNPEAKLHVEQTGRNTYLHGANLFEPLVFVHNVQDAGNAYVNNPRRTASAPWGPWHSAIRGETAAANAVAVLGVQDTTQSIAGYQESAGVFGWSNAHGNASANGNITSGLLSAGVWGRVVHPTSASIAGVVGECWGKNGYAAIFRGGVGTFFEYSGTAGETGLIIADPNMNFYRRILVGPPDSGGTGYRMLRVAN